MITEKKVQKIIKDTDNKQYLQERGIISLLSQCEVLLNQAFISQNKGIELLYVLMKQLTELKSNYIIRQSNLIKIVKYIQKLPEEQQEEFYDKFIPQVKKLLGVSSDTSKSAWFDYLLFQKMEYGGSKVEEFILPEEKYEQLYLENNRVILDAITKLSQKIEFTEEEQAILSEERKSITRRWVRLMYRIPC